QVGGKKPGFLRSVPCEVGPGDLKNVLPGKSFRNRVSSRAGENRVSGRVSAAAATALRSALQAIARLRRGNPVLSTSFSDAPKANGSRELLPERRGAAR